MKQCKVCSKKVSHGNISGLCQKCYRDNEDKLKVDKWLNTGDTSCGTSTTLRGPIRAYLYESQNNSCAICSVDREWNNKPLNFILDHIDGNAANNVRSNLRLICHNCDSQLETYKSKNKNSARSHRKGGLPESGLSEQS